MSNGMENKISRIKTLPGPLRVVLILFSIVLLACIGVAGKLKYEQGKMSPLETGVVVPGVYAINNGFVNLYIIEKDGAYLMIDGGANATRTATGLQQIGVDPRDIGGVLLTHSDSDHIGALELLMNPEVYLPSEEIQMIDGSTNRNILGKNRLEYDYISVADGEIFELEGFTVECVSTPGHTPGSMCYLIDGAYLFTGDAMSLNKGKASLFNSFYNMDDGLQADSIRKLAERVNPQYIFTGHYGYTDNSDKAFGDWK